MKKIRIKRLVYNHLGTGEAFCGAEEYDGNLTADNILGSVFELGKHKWTPNFDHHAMYQMNDKGELTYRIEVGIFYQYQKSWYDDLFDIIKRILRI